MQWWKDGRLLWILYLLITLFIHFINSFIQNFFIDILHHFFPSPSFLWVTSFVLAVPTAYACGDMLFLACWCHHVHVVTCCFLHVGVIMCMWWHVVSCMWVSSCACGDMLFLACWCHHVLVVTCCFLHVGDWMYISLFGGTGTFIFHCVF